MSLTPWQKAFGRDFPGAPHKGPEDSVDEKQSSTYVLQYFNGIGWDPQFGFGPFMNKIEAENEFAKCGYAKLPSRYRIVKYGACDE